ncbi:hypothetical protein FHS56_002329 [Thermonema lapsum]|uniref:Uncharacterized protein n=1 Tax=Thermonema lapsum TaxID=28195 RepID=A0A846MT75_9BACT|nr:hypothetical protein [Thermonema lapsum]
MQFFDFAKPLISFAFFTKSDFKAVAQNCYFVACILLILRESCVFDFIACLHRLGNAFDRQVFDEHEGIVIVQFIAIGTFLFFASELLSSLLDSTRVHILGRHRGCR